ncbi:MAG TPA: hypothetical protein VEY31_08395, partial [Roseococcus sp.]|nr:hypothetical protein [Roseococcus sp.]
MSEWRDRALVATEAAMKERERDGRDEELLRLKAKLGEVTMANELLDLLVGQVPGMALLAIVTHRPEFDAGAWLGAPHVTPLQINRLAATECTAVLRRVAGKVLPPEAEAMSQAVSPITGRSYGLARVARVWRLTRARLY